VDKKCGSVDGRSRHRNIVEHFRGQRGTVQNGEESSVLKFVSIRQDQITSDKWLKQ
jgi:hypothetical protein